MSRHPKTGLTYVHVIPNDAAYAEILRCYFSASWSLPWLIVLDPYDFKGRAAEFLGSNEHAVVFWTTPEVNISGRKCLAAVHYSELIPEGAYEFPSDEQKAAFEKFIAKVGGFDTVFVHSPSSVEPMRRLVSVPVHCVPVGYDLDTLGTPDFGVEKTRALVFYGFQLTRRKKLIPDLCRALGFNVPEVAGYGRERNAELNTARGILLVHHGRGFSFPTFRIWQAVATSAVLFTEPGDAWPAVKGRHYVEIPWIDDGDGAAARVINERLADWKGLLEMARRAHEELREWTVGRAIEMSVEKLALAGRTA